MILLQKNTTITKVANFLWYIVIPLLIIGIVIGIVPATKTTETLTVIQTSYQPEIGMALICEDAQGKIFPVPVKFLGASPRGVFPD